MSLYFISGLQELELEELELELELELVLELSDTGLLTSNKERSVASNVIVILSSMLLYWLQEDITDGTLSSFQPHLYYLYYFGAFIRNNPRSAAMNPVYFSL